MNKKIVVFICVIISVKIFGLTPVYAEGITKTKVELCCNDVVYSVNYTYEVFGTRNILDVTVSDTNYTCEWEFDQTESMFYLNISSKAPIAKDKTIATITWSGNDIFLLIVPVRIQVNGTVNSGVRDYHQMMLLDWIEPGIDNPGYWNGIKCSNCGVVIQEPQEIPPKGPEVKAVLNDRGILFVSGAISDSPIAKCATFLSVYNNDKKMLGIKNITDFDQSNFRVSFDSVENPETVKILRWNIENLKPLYNTVEVKVAN